jgi:hypothetical protein
MPRKKQKTADTKPETVTELLEIGLFKPASELESPVFEFPPLDRETVFYGTKGPRRRDEPTPLREVSSTHPSPR